MFSKSIDRNTILMMLSLVVSANIAFFLYHYFHWQEGFWSVVTVAAVITADLSNTIDKMMARLLGTIIGAAYAYFAVYFFLDAPVVLAILLAVGIFIASIIALQSNMLYYAGIVCNITIIMVIATSIDTGNFYQIAVDRTFEVCMGIIIAGAVTTLLTKFFVVTKPPANLLIARVKEVGHSIKTLEMRTAILLTALKVVIATALTFVPWLYFRYPGGFWATISCFFIIEESLKKTHEKGLLRFLAHLIAASFGLISVILIGGHSWLLMIPLTLGLVICGYILAQGKGLSGMGNTAGIALGIMLLADPGTQGSLEIILARFINVVLGIGVGILICTLPILKQPEK